MTKRKRIERADNGISEYSNASVVQRQNSLFQQEDGGSIPTPTLHIEHIEKMACKRMLSKYHYLGDKGFRSHKNFGLLINEYLIGCIIFHGVSAPETVVGAFGLERNNQDGIWEIGRLVMIPEANKKNYGSYLISRSIRQLCKEEKVRAIITYADSKCHVGSVYQASNFLYCGLTDSKKDFVVGCEVQERGRVVENDTLFSIDDKRW